MTRGLAGWLPHCPNGSVLARLWIRYWPVLGLLPPLVQGAGGAVPTAFFVLVLLWPATLLVTRIAGVPAGAVCGGVCVVLLAAQAVLPPPEPAIQPDTLWRRFDHPQQAARHSMRLPVRERDWAAMWARRTEPEAYLYFLLVIHETVRDPALTVWLNDEELGHLSAATEVAVAAAFPQHWHRLPVRRDQLEASEVTHVRVALRAAAPPPAGGVGLVGTYSLRPTFGPAASAFFDGRDWSMAPRVVLPELPPPPNRDVVRTLVEKQMSAADPVRYVIELRILDPAAKRWLAVYY